MSRDWALRSGERQTASHIRDVDAAHRARYEWAAARLGVVTHGLDAFCATGYGTGYLAATCGGDWTGLDGSTEAVTLAASVYPSCTFRTQMFPSAFPTGMDAVVSLESIEHVKEDRAFAETLAGSLALGGRLVVSTPDERGLPLSVFRNRFHVRHYTPESLTKLFDGLGLHCTHRAAQMVHGIARDASGIRRTGRVPEAEQGVTEDPLWQRAGSFLLAAFTRVSV
jgi:2-polyprenyl-3-methyl-5-hydroxy-6-metoxy-1,4-benzoquinol methylase